MELSAFDNELDKYIKENGITFELRAVNGDGEVILKATSDISFDDVTMSSYQLEEQLHKMVLESANDEGDDSELLRQ